MQLFAAKAVPTLINLCVLCASAVNNKKIPGS
jgi:hypothetical protein